ncbi:MAG: response regulator [Variovorax sp.]|nr:response regulator [Variovorax sp.]
MHRILVVEDDRDLREATVRMLESLGHWASGVSSAEIALNRFIAGGFDIVITDVGLPGLSGLQLAEKLKEVVELPVIFASGLPAPPSLPSHFVWLSKPYTLAQVESALAAATRPGAF